MVVDKVDKGIPQSYARQYGTYEGELAYTDAYQEASRVIKPAKPREAKLLGSIREVIEKAGLEDGIAVSFHHHFREGDHIMSLVLVETAVMGLKSISITPGSIANVHEPSIEHIGNGVVASITSSGLKDEVGAAISTDTMESPMVTRSHGDWARTVVVGGIHIDVAFLGASNSGVYGNANGTKGKVTCGSLGCAMVDAKYADQVVITTGTLVPYLNTPIGVPQTGVDYMIETDAIGDPGGVVEGATRFTKDPKELPIAEYVTGMITRSLYYKEGLSSQAGTGGSSLAVARFVREQILEDGIKTSFVLGGIMNVVVELSEEGLVEKIIDVQDSDHPLVVSLGENASHYEIDANMYTSPLSKGTVIDQLDTAILSALEVDTGFNVSVITGSNGITHGAPNGHFDTSMACKMSLVITPLVRGRIPTTVEQVNTVVTPGTSVDIVITGVGVAINPERADLIDYFKTLDVPQSTLEELKDKAYNIVGTPEPIRYGDKITVSIEYRDGNLIDVVRNV